MKQYVIVIDGEQFLLCENWDEVENKLKVRTFEWCLEPNYIGESWRKLFHKCINEKDFGDIASVFEVQGSFYSDKQLIWNKLM